MKQKIKVLLIDDDAQFYKLKLGDLKEFDVDFAVNSREVLTKLANNTYQVAFLDINLDGENGIDLIKLLQKHRVSVALFTTDVNTLNTQKAAQLWVEERLGKPFSVREFVDMVYKVVDPTFVNKKTKKDAYRETLLSEAASSDESYRYEVKSLRKSVTTNTSGFSYEYLVLKIYRPGKVVAENKYVLDNVMMAYFKTLESLPAEDRFYKVIEWTKPEFREMLEYRLALLDWMVESNYLSKNVAERLSIKERSALIPKKSQKVDPSRLVRIGD